MIIGQISDLHIGFAGENKPCKNTDRLNLVLDAFDQMLAPPDIIVVSGDLVEHGEPWAYKALKKALKPIKPPVYLAFGNHDCRDAFKIEYPDTQYVDGFFQYTIEDYPVRIIVLDTLKEGRHGGSFCEIRARWLEQQLAQQPQRPTMIFMHHPPVATGINWMTADPQAQWVKLLESVISKYDNIVHIAAGHIHRNIFKNFAGTTLSITQAIAPQTKLELADIDPDVPDGRGLLVDADPGFCLHYWDGSTMTTHIGQAPCGKTLIDYTEKYAHVVRHTLDLDP